MRVWTPHCPRVSSIVGLDYGDPVHHVEHHEEERQQHPTKVLMLEKTK